MEGGGVKSLRTGGRRVLKNFRTGGVTDLGGGGTFAGGSVPHYMPCITKFDTYQQKNPEFSLILPFFRFFFFSDFPCIFLTVIFPGVPGFFRSV